MNQSSIRLPQTLGAGATIPEERTPRERKRAAIAIAGALVLGVTAQVLLWRVHIGLSWLVVVALVVAGSFAVFGRGAVRARFTPLSIAMATGALVSGAAVVYYASDWALYVAFPASVAFLVLLPIVIARGIGARDASVLPRAFFESVNAAPFAIAAAAKLPRDAVGTKARPYAWGVLRGLLLGAPAVIVFVALLSADANFAHAIDAALDRAASGAELAIYSVLTAVAFLVVYALHTRAAPTPQHESSIADRPVPYRIATDAFPYAAPAPRGPIVRPFTWGVVLAQIALVFAVFVAVNVKTFFAGHAFLQAHGTTTYARHVHAGFAQLFIASLLATAAIIVGHRLVRDRDDATPRAIPGGAALAAIETIILALTAVTLVSCFQRLRLYEEVYGYTYLRLAVGFFHAGILAVLAATVVKSIARAWRGYGSAIVGVVCAFTIAASCIDADAYVAHGNVERARAGRPLDYAYLSTLSSDAADILADPLVTSVPDEADYVRDAWRDRAAKRAAEGWRGKRGIGASVP